MGHAFEIDRSFAAAVRAPRRLGEARRDTARAVRCPRGARYLGQVPAAHPLDPKRRPPGRGPVTGPAMIRSAP